MTVRHGTEPHVVVEQSQRALLQGFGGGPDLGEHREAVPDSGCRIGPVTALTITSAVSLLLTFTQSRRPGT